jgi:predicted secreted protein
MAHPTEGFVNGSDLLLFIDTSITSTPEWTAVAHTTSHTVDYSSETKDRVTKDISSNGKWKSKAVSGISATITCEGLMIYDSDKLSYKTILAKMKAGQTVLLKFGFREEAEGDTYEQGLFVISSISQTSPAGEDTTFSATFENSGEVTTEVVEI